MVETVICWINPDGGPLCPAFSMLPSTIQLPFRKNADKIPRNIPGITLRFLQTSPIYLDGTGEKEQCCLKRGDKAMAECELLKGCLFFNDKMPNSSGLGAMYKRNYCQGNNTRCARYMVAKSLGREKVPANLYPNMFDRAKQLIGG